MNIASDPTPVPAGSLLSPEADQAAALATANGILTVDLDAVIAVLTARRAGLHVIVTGRNAKPELIAAADLVTEMTLVKHHFAAGVKAQPGIEF